MPPKPTVARVSNIRMCAHTHTHKRTHARAQQCYSCASAQSSEGYLTQHGCVRAGCSSNAGVCCTLGSCRMAARSKVEDTPAAAHRVR
mgnify:CR=1 FL=1